jgi:hypothetical protein
MFAVGQRSSNRGDGDPRHTEIFAGHEEAIIKWN